MVCPDIGEAAPFVDAKPGGGPVYKTRPGASPADVSKFDAGAGLWFPAAFGVPGAGLASSGMDSKRSAAGLKYVRVESPGL